MRKLRDGAAINLCFELILLQITGPCGHSSIPSQPTIIFLVMLTAGSGRSAASLLGLVICCLTLLTAASASSLLKNNWSTADSMYSPLARRIHQKWSNCSSEIVFHQFRNLGMGSDL